MISNVTGMKGTFDDYYTLLLLASDMCEKLMSTSQAIDDMPHFVEDKDTIIYEKEIFHNVRSSYLELVETLATSVDIDYIIDTLSEFLESDGLEEYTREEIEENEAMLEKMMMVQDFIARYRKE